MNDQLKKLISEFEAKNHVKVIQNGNKLTVDLPMKLERKGAYVKELFELDNDLPIVNKAIVKYISQGIPV